MSLPQDGHANLFSLYLQIYNLEAMIEADCIGRALAMAIAEMACQIKMANIFKCLEVSVPLKCPVSIQI
jgi:hypothetical protein